MTTEQTLVRGAQVVSSDGEELGFVGEVSADAFEVEVNSSPEYWLPLSCVTSADAVAVRLECSMAEAEEHHLAKGADGSMTMNVTERDSEPGMAGDAFPTKNRCETCGAAFTTGALLRDHLRIHDARSATEKDTILEEQGERKP